MGGADDEGIPYFEKVGEWDRAKNIIILNPWHTDDKGRPMPYKWPVLWALPGLPLVFGYHLTGMALNATGAIKSEITVSEHIAGLMRSVIAAFTPFEALHNPNDLYTPELLKGPAHVMQNKDWLNHPIHRDPAFQKGPAAWSGKDMRAGEVRTGEGWKWIAQNMNDITGGSRVKSGYIDAFPETYRELANQPIGAQLRFFRNLWDTGSSIAKGEVPKASKIPFAKTFIGTDYDAADRARRAKRYFESRRPWEH
jgi:hypothetical protein